MPLAGVHIVVESAGELDFYIVHWRTHRRRFRFPKIALSTKAPTLRSKPWRVVGIPVARAIFCLAAVIPTARFHEKDKPGSFIVLLVIRLSLKSTEKIHYKAYSKNQCRHASAATAAFPCAGHVILRS
jgi:hypothetical protein